MKINPLHAADFYKTGHVIQYPPGTTAVYSNYTPRSSVHANVSSLFDGKVVFVGLQGVIEWLLTDLWQKEFFNQDRENILRAYEARVGRGLGIQSAKVDHIGALWDLGYLPIKIKALPEGSRVDIRVPVFTVTNTHPDFYWLTNYIETQLSAEIWKTITSATTAFEYRRIFEHYAEATGAPTEFISWQGHDFSMRGMSGIHDAAQTGIGHLCSFYGTDTIPALDYLERYYCGGDSFLGGSVPATEHSVMCMGGEDDEYGTFKRLITETYPSGIVSIVSDTWDFWHVITKTALDLKDEILARKPDALGNAKVVFRPDSGDPVKILTGYMDHETIKHFDYDSGRITKITDFEGNTLTDAEIRGAVECLWDIFGGDINSRGFKSLNPRVGLIYGDSITLERQEQILYRLMMKGFASNNVVLGIGSYTYQMVSRDTFGQAIKATWGVVDGKPRELSKDPKTDKSGKKSAKGLLRVEQEDGKFVLYDQQTVDQEAQGLLKTVWENGKFVGEKQTIADIRSRLHEGKSL